MGESRATSIRVQPLGAAVGDLLDKPLDHGGLNLSRPIAWAVLAVVIIALIAFCHSAPAAIPARQAQQSETIRIVDNGE